MPLPLLILAAAAVQPAPSAPSSRGAGRAFVSPMGEPFRGRTPGEDGLVVWFAQADSNHDGVLTSDEMAADADRFFQFLDLNHDGEIDPDEITHYEGVIVPQLRVQSVITAADLPGGEHVEHFDDESSAGRFGLLQIPEPVASADTNFDRGVSAAEFRAAAKQRFQLLDVNHSGQLKLAALENIRGAASANAEHKRNQTSDPRDNPTSAEYGPQSQPQR